MHGQPAPVMSFERPGEEPARGPVAAVIGGAGFIGSHLCEALLARGREVVCIDSFRRGSIHNLTGLIGQRRGAVVSHDVLRRIPDELPRFDEIYHLVGAPEGRGMDERVQARRAVRMAVRVLDRAARDGARVLLACRGGDPAPGATQNVMAHLFARCAEKRGVSLDVVAAAHLYGPRMPLESGCGVSDFALRALRGEPIRISDPRTTLRLRFVRDEVDGWIRQLEGRPGAASRLAAEPAEITHAALARAILELTGSASALSIPAASAAGLAARSAADGMRGVGAAGAAGGTPLREGLRMTLEDLACRFGVTSPAARQRVG
ncbi:NAD-dependent epimerase/dehydratase family protein [Phenylobacterium sp.]|uniref:NAD-dependent epimerase/dehydratase family protein n=1 Tax=Phenylobacterium sp. TaxID=1871053 RepID=UPI0035B2D410